MFLYLFCFVCLFYSPLSIVILLPAFLFMSHLLGKKKAIIIIVIGSIISILLGILTNHDSLSYRLQHDIYGIYRDMYIAHKNGGQMITNEDFIFNNINLINFGIVGLGFSLFASKKNEKKTRANI